MQKQRVIKQLSSSLFFSVAASLVEARLIDSSCDLRDFEYFVYFPQLKFPPFL